MKPRVQFALRSSTNSVGRFPTTGYRQLGNTIAESIVIADACEPGRALSPDEAEAIQCCIDANEAWRRGEAFGRKCRAFIDRGEVALARRSYAPNPKVNLTIK